MEEKYLEEEVKGFYIEKDWYYAVLKDGTVLNIVRSAAIQPQIYNPYDYYTYLLTETKEGIFLFRQRIAGSKAMDWVCEREIVSNGSPSFFDRAFEYLQELLFHANHFPPCF